jgi:hypothetical protein
VIMSETDPCTCWYTAAPPAEDGRPGSNGQNRMGRPRALTSEKHRHELHLSRRSTSCRAHRPDNMTIGERSLDLGALCRLLFGTKALPISNILDNAGSLRHVRECPLRGQKPGRPRLLTAAAERRPRASTRTGVKRPPPAREPTPHNVCPPPTTAEISVRRGLVRGGK